MKTTNARATTVQEQLIEIVNQEQIKLLKQEQEIIKILLDQGFYLAEKSGDIHIQEYLCLYKGIGIKVKWHSSAKRAYIYAKYGETYGYSSVKSLYLNAGYDTPELILLVQDCLDFAIKQIQDNIDATN